MNPEYTEKNPIKVMRYLALLRLLKSREFLLFFFLKKEEISKKEENRPMGYISIHYSIEEYKSDDGEESGVGFLIACDPIGVNNLLECDCEVICAKITWRLLRVLSFSVYLAYWD